MTFDELLNTVSDEPLFDTGFLLVGQVDSLDVRRQLSRWTAAKRIYQLRRGLYALAPPYQKRTPHPFLIANQLVRASYVSCQTALAYYGLIPEYAPVIISMTTRRPGSWQTPLGSYLYRHIKNEKFFGFQQQELPANQRAFVATPEKALLDLIYWQPHGDSPSYLSELRLQNLERLQMDVLVNFAQRMNSPKVQRAVAWLILQAQRERGEYELL